MKAERGTKVQGCKGAKGAGGALPCVCIKKKNTDGEAVGKNSLCPSVFKRRAFTLVEVLIAVALLGMLLAGIATLAFQLMGYWARQAEDPLFDRHVDGLRRALEECVAESNDAENTQGQARTAKNVFRERPGGAAAPYLRITGTPEFLISDARPLGNVDGWLEFRDGSGLILLWRTDAEKRDSPEGTHEFVLSPWVTGMTFSSYEGTGDAWVDLGATPDGAGVANNSAIFMKLTLEHRGQKREINLTLADSAPHNLNY